MNDSFQVSEPLYFNEIEALKRETFRQLEFNQVLEFISKFTRSELGKNIILKIQPGENIDATRHELDLTGEMTDLIALDDELPFQGISDIRTKLYKSMMDNAVMSTEEILLVCDSIRVFRLIRNYFLARSEKYTGLWSHAELLHENRLLEKHIFEAIDETGEIRDNASRELARIRFDIKEKSQRLRVKVNKILKRVAEDEMVQDEFVSIREGRFVLPLKAENKRAFPGIIHGVSQSGSTVFIEPSEIIEMNNELSLLLNEERREIMRILSHLTMEIGKEAQQFISSLEIIAHLDSVWAKARYALEYKGIKPTISDDNEIMLRRIRHPLLVHTKGLQRVKPLTIEFGDKIYGHLISGPNAGGKTVALKSIGLNILLALSGIFPLGEVKTNFRTVYSAIGDNQSIENDLSTFSSQVLQLKRIIDYCDSNSLILVDEIGSGTDPQEGSALACGILDTFVGVKLFFVATTHQSSLKTYALNRPEIENASLEFDEANLKPTYNFQSGIPGNSYAFVLAENIGLSKLVLNRAHEYLGSRQKDLEESISVLQQYRNDAIKIKSEAERERIKFEQLRKDYENRLSGIQEKRRELLDQARDEAGSIVHNANALVENTIREIREEKKSISEIKREYNAKKEEIEKKVKESPKPIDEDFDEPDLITNEEITAGDTVVMEGSTNQGTIIELEPASGIALVEFNGFKFRLPIKQLTKVRKKSKKRDNVNEFFKLDGKSRIDVRGLRQEETLKEIDKFISDALISNVDVITIVHGKGTGALRQAIHELLKTHHSVKSFRLGELVEGGAGVTIAEL